MKNKLITVLGALLFSGLVATSSYSAGCEEELTACQQAYDSVEQKENNRTCHSCHVACLRAVTKCHYSGGQEPAKAQATKLLETCNKRCY